ncbi:TetR/AcrR family transcriptional regulator [Rhizobium sp.]|jgi:TetR/AcrR family transcriptional regulator, transcriptional repressor for nem operon|uniref:TetR/AcrR family transcriptional regulator n=1 Tax=Rhizobium sp. TaxID=391 RepID=UPI000E825770|nr:TetR family transcriptional regulator [Rhizobium sp.]
MNTKEALIASTQELLWTRGYTGTSPRAILDHSGVGQGSLYHYFSGKSDLARVAIERSAERMKARVATCLLAGGRPIDRLLAFLNDDRPILRGCPIGRLTADPEIAADETLRSIVADALQRCRVLLVQTIEQAMVADELAKDMEPSVLADLMLSTLQGGLVLAGAAASDVPYRNSVAALITLLRRPDSAHR